MIRSILSASKSLRIVLYSPLVFVIITTELILKAGYNQKDIQISYSFIGLLLKDLESEKKVIKHFYGLLPVGTKDKLKINIEKELTFYKCERIYNCLLDDGWFQKQESLDLTDLCIDELPLSLFCHMKNLKKLILSGNHSLNWKSEAFKDLCNQLVELDVSNCSIDTESFGIICKNCSKLEKLNMSNNLNINFSSHDLENLRKSVKCLKARNCCLNSGDMLEIAKFERLWALDVSNNFLEEFFAQENLGNLEKTLKDLRVSKTGLKYNDICKIRKCLQINTLDLSHNDLSKRIDDNCTSRYIFGKVGVSRHKVASVNDDVFLGNLEMQLEVLLISRANLDLDQLKEILDFSSIRVLDCSFNDFSKLGNSFRIGKAKKSLKEVNFSKCYLSNQIFLEEILDCPGLTKLDISINNFGAKHYYFVFGSATNSLKWLDISESKIEVHSFIKILAESKVLEYLDISKNNFESKSETFNPNSSVSMLGNLKESLKTIKVSDCEIKNDYNFLYSLTECKNLEFLDVSLNDFSNFPKNFSFGSSQKTLKSLHMKKCSLDRRFLFLLANLESLEILNVSDNCFSKNFTEFSFGNANVSLAVIDMSSCQIECEFLLKEITSCPKLKVLNLSSNNFKKLSPNFNFGASKNTLEILNMSKCCLRGLRILSKITDCRKLRKLNLSGNAFSGQQYENFSFGFSSETLRMLELDFCKISDHNLFAAITSCQNLEVLSIAGNEMKDCILGESKNSLKSLDISNITFSTIENFYQFFDCSNLQTLIISGSSLKKFEKSLTFDRFGSSKTTLRRLVAVKCGLEQHSSLSVLTSFPRLEIIDVSGNFFEKFPYNFSLGASKYTLTAIVAKKCNIKSNYTVKALTDCGKLEILMLDYNQILWQAGKIEFGISINSLKVLSLEGCLINFLNWVDEVKKCRNLYELNLSSNYLVSIKNEFDFDGFKKSIVALKMSNCGINNLKILSSLAKYYKLEYLEMDDNKLKDLHLMPNFSNLCFILDYFFLRGCGLESSLGKQAKDYFKFAKEVELS